MPQRHSPSNGRFISGGTGGKSVAAPKAQGRAIGATPLRGNNGPMKIAPSNGFKRVVQVPHAVSGLTKGKSTMNADTAHAKAISAHRAFKAANPKATSAQIKAHSDKVMASVKKLREG